MFSDRAQAGEKLARRLSRLHLENPVVLALPRGGVPVAAEIARGLDAPLDLILVKKIGAPSQPELAIGAVVDGNPPAIVINEDLQAAIGLDPIDLETLTSTKIRELQQLRARYLHGRQPMRLIDRTAIVVDDGVATGASLKAALAGLKNRQPARIILALPVAPSSTLQELQSLVDEVICLETPEPFYAVGMHFRDFDQVSDQTVVATLTEFAFDSD